MYFTLFERKINVSEISRRFARLSKVASDRRYCNRLHLKRSYLLSFFIFFLPLSFLRATSFWCTENICMSGMDYKRSKERDKRKEESSIRRCLIFLISRKVYTYWFHDISQVSPKCIQSYFFFLRYTNSVVRVYII